jgi:uncharacterized membrane protein YdbT with pleckstrin-like domain
VPRRSLRHRARHRHAPPARRLLVLRTGSIIGIAFVACLVVFALDFDALDIIVVLAIGGHGGVLGAAH